MQKTLQFVFYVFMLLLPFQTRYIFIPSDNQYAQIGIYVFDIVCIILLGLFLLWWYKQPQTKVYWPLAWLCISIVGVTALSAYWTKFHTEALYYWLHLLQAMIVCGIVFTQAVPTKHILRLLLANGIIQAIFIIWESITQHVIASKWLGIAAQVPETAGVSVIATNSERWLRAYGTLPHPNTAGAVLVLAILAGIILWKIDRNTAWKKIFTSVGTLVSSFVVVLTFSRGALLVLLAACLAFFVMRYKTTPIISAIFVTMGIVTSIYFFAMYSRLSTEIYTEQYSIAERESQFGTTWSMFSSVWPFGVGIGGYTLAAEGENVQPVHFLPLLIAAETGFIVPILLYVLAGWALWRIDTKKPLSIGVTIIGAACIGLGFVDHYFWTLPSMLIVWFIIIALQFREGRKNPLDSVRGVS